MDSLNAEGGTPVIGHIIFNEMVAHEAFLEIVNGWNAQGLYIFCSAIKNTFL